MTKTPAWPLREMTRTPLRSQVLGRMLVVLLAGALAPGCLSSSHVPGASEARVQSTAQEEQRRYREARASAGEEAPAVERPDSEMETVEAERPEDDEIAEPEIAAEEPPRSAEGTPCALPLTPSALDGLRTNVSLDGDIAMTTRYEHDSESDRLRQSFRYRSHDGLVQGEEIYRCHGDYLELERVVFESMEMRFVPALPVFGPAGSSSSMDTVVLLNDGGQHRSFSATWEAEFSEGEVPSDDDRADNVESLRFIQVDSRLILEDEEGALSSSWQSDTLWGFSDDTLVPALREQRIGAAPTADAAESSDELDPTLRRETLRLFWRDAS